MVKILLMIHFQPFSPGDDTVISNPNLLIERHYSIVPWTNLQIDFGATKS